MENSNVDLEVLVKNLENMDSQVLGNKDNVSVLSEENDINKSMSSKSRMEKMDGRLDSMDGRLDIMDVRLDQLSLEMKDLSSEMKDGFADIRKMLETLVQNKESPTKERKELDDPKTAEELKKYKGVMWSNFEQIRGKVKHIEDGLAHNYGEMNKLSLSAKENFENINKIMERVSSVVEENKMQTDENINAMGAVIDTQMEDVRALLQSDKSNVTSYWDPYARMIVQFTPEEAIKDLRTTTSQMYNNLMKMEKSLEGIEKKVNDAECYVNLVREQPSENAAPTIKGWIQNLDHGVEWLKTELRLNKESTESEFKKLSEGAIHYKYRIEQVEQNYNTVGELIREVRNDIVDISTQKEAYYSMPNGEPKLSRRIMVGPDDFENNSKEEGELKETKSEMSFTKLNISPIHNRSKSSIMQDKKVKSCNYEMGEVRTDFAVVTYNPYDTGRFSFSSNLMLYDVDDKGIIRYGLVKRTASHTLFPNFYDYSASGYVLDNESNYEAMTRVIFKELNVIVNNAFLIQHFLLEWSPYLHSDNIKLERFSVGRLYFCEIKVFVSITDVSTDRFTFLTAEEAASEQLKPDLAQLFSNHMFMNQVYTKVLTVRCSPSKDFKDDIMEGKFAYPKPEPKTGNKTTFREEGSYSHVNRTSFRGFDSMNRSRAVRYNDESVNEETHGGNGNIMSRSPDPLNERSRRTEFHDRRDDEIIIKLPDDSEEHAMQLIKLYGPVVKTQTEPDLKNVFLEKLNVTNILAFLRAVLLEERRMNAGTIKISDYMSPKIIDELELIAEQAMEIHKVELRGRPSEGHIRARGVQRITNMDIYKILAFAVRPVNYEELKERMKTKVFPKSDHSFKDEANVTNNFREFLMATHHYIDRFLELKKLVTYHSSQFYPDILFKKGETIGQVDFFIYGFPCYDFVKNIVSSMNHKVRNSMDSFSDFTGTLMRQLHDMDIHYTVNMKFFKSFWRKRGHYKQEDDTDKADPDYKRHSRGKQRVMIMDEQESGKEDGLTIEEGSEDSEDEGTRSEEDQKDVDTEVSELSSQHDINIIQSKKTLSNNVCYEFLNKGKCNIAGCIYNHDPVAVEKFKTTYKTKSFSKPKTITTPGKRRA